MRVGQLELRKVCVIALVGELESDYEVGVVQLRFLRLVDDTGGKFTGESQEAVSCSKESIIGVIDSEVGSGCGLHHLSVLSVQFAQVNLFSKH